MEVILLKNIGTLGDKHDVVRVKNGYGRNYLIPKGLAAIANTQNLSKLDDIIAKEKAEEEKRVDEFREMVEQMKDKKLKIGVKAGTTGKIFGSITNIQIANALREQLELDIPRKKVILDDDIKEVGTYSANIVLHPEISHTIEFELIKE